MAGFFVHPGAVKPYEQGLPPTALGARAHYYTRLAARAGSVLEYGAGRGSLTWPMAQAGARVTATDLSTALLSSLEQAGAEFEPAVRRRVRTRAGDMRTLRLRHEFPLVIAPSNTFLHLYNRRDVEAFLSNVRHHLTPEGTFVFDVTVPRPEELAQDYDPVAQIKTLRLAADVVLAERQYFPRELPMLLEYNGFSTVRLRGDFGRRRPGPTTEVLVFTAQAVPSRSRATRAANSGSKPC